MGEIIAKFEQLNALSVALRLLLSILFGGVIGWERQGNHHPAGLRTHILVCIGSTMTTIVGQYMFLQFGSDPSRIGAQVVSGIGFLGVGTIILNGGHVRGITTAAGLWASACMGLALGIGFYEGAIIGFLAVVFALIIIRKINNFYYKRHPRRKFVKIYLKQMTDIAYISKLLHTWGVIVQNAHISHTHENDENFSNGVMSILELNMKSYVDSNAVLVDLLKENCVLSADYIKPQESLTEEDTDPL